MIFSNERSIFKVVQEREVKEVQSLYKVGQYDDQAGLAGITLESSLSEASKERNNLGSQKQTSIIQLKLYKMFSCESLVYRIGFVSIIFALFILVYLFMCL